MNLPKTPPQAKDLFFLGLTIFLGVLIFLPQTDYVPLFAPGDHGRSFFMAQQILHGFLPIQDYSFVYGPLMPFYYATFFKILGMSFSSLLIGEILLKMLAGILIYKSLRYIINPLWSFSATLWFWTNYHFFHHTFNHTGATTLQLAIVYFLISFYFHRRQKYIYFSFLAVFLIFLIKLNFGLSALLSLLAVLWFFNRSKIPYPLSRKSLFVVFPGVILFSCFLIYHYLSKDLTPHEYIQTFVLSKAYRQNNFSLFFRVTNLYTLTLKYIAQPLSSGFFLLSLLAIIKCIFIFTKKKTAELNPAKMLSVILVIFAGFQFHEYILSGVSYRIYSLAPFIIPLIFMHMYIAFKDSPRIIPLFLLCFLTYQSLFQHFDYMKDKWQNALLLKTQHHHLFVGNDAYWVKTVQDTTNFLESELSEDDKIYAIPYNLLYYFLLDKEHPTWLVALFAFRHVPNTQELGIIQDLVDQDVEYILLDSRIRSFERGLGFFGKDYGRLLKIYIDQNYEVIAEFGDFNYPGGWAWEHATQILKKK